MIGYVRRLQSLDPADSVVANAERTIVLLTGLSSYASARLTDAQRSFLHAVAPPGVHVVAANFPYHPEFLSSAAEPPSILAASVRNTLQGVAAVTVPAFRRAIARHLQPLFDRTERRLVVITGSCGVTLLGAALAHVVAPDRLSLSVIALGPVGPRLRGPANMHVIRGHRDWISRALSSGGSDDLGRGDHLSYYREPTIIGLVRTRCAREFYA